MKSPETPDKSATPEKGDRIAKLLARAGIASRREVERMITEGRVRIGEDVVTTPATILTNLRGVSVDGKPVAAAPPPRLFRFHKPSGLITAERDPTGRPTIYTALRNAMPPEAPRVMPVGRLDLNTEGLLLMTNDGEMKRALELPASGIPRTYRARTFGEVSQAMLEDLMDGIEIEGIRYGPINANMERSTGHNKWIELTLTEGKNREVRRVLEHLGLQVSRLMRLAYGPFILADLPRGAVEEVRPADVERFRATLKIAPASFAGAVALPVRPPRSTPRRPESVVAAKPEPRAPVKRPDDQRRGASRPAYNRADSPAAESKPAEKRAPPKRAPRRDDDRDSTLVDRPKLGRAKPALRSADPSKADPKPAKTSTKGWAKAKPKAKRIGPAQVRIIAGEWRGRPLVAPAGETTRPTADRTRETLFSMLVSRLGSFEGLAVADLFAGSGALGLEALSRGAASALFVEQDAAAIRALRSNIANLGAQSRSDVRASSVLSLGPAKVPLDVLFLDPPYGSGAGAVAIDKLVRLGWIGEATWVSLETGAAEIPELRVCEVESERKVGKARLTLLRLKA